MTRPLTVAGRIHAALLHRLIPSLDRTDAEDAALTFDELRRAARARSLAAWAAVWWREARSLFATVRHERRRLTTGSGRKSGFGWLEVLVSDVRYGGRHLFRSPVFTVTSAVSVAVGIAAVVSVFTVVYGVLWRPLPVTDPDRIVRLAYGRDNGIWSYPDYEDAVRLAPALSSAAAFSTRPIVITTPGSAPREVKGDGVSRNFFSVIDVPLTAGRGFVADDPDEVAVISDRLWREAYGADRSVVGRTLEIQGREHVIVGVAPRSLQSLEGPVKPAVWFPIAQEQRERRGWRSLRVAGRLAPGATLQQAQAQLEAAALRLAEENPDLHRDSRGQVLPIVAAGEVEGRLPAADRIAVTAAVSAAFGLVALILAMVASNVANLLLGRATARRQEIAVRLALGAGRSRIIRQLLVESLLLAAMSGGLALLAVRGVLVALAGGIGIPAISDLAFAVDWRVTAFASVVTIGVGVLFGLAPALQASRFDLMTIIRGGDRPFAKFGLRRALVNVQVAGAVVLTATALLFLNGLNRISRLDTGFDSAGVTVLDVDLKQRQYTPEQAARLFDEAASRLRAVPGVAAVAWARNVPLSGNSMATLTKDIEGYNPSAGGEIHIGMNIVSPGYFDLLRIPLRAGREFADTDRAGAPRVAIVNEAFAKRFWPGDNPIGKRIDDRTVVGVTANLRAQSFNDLEMPFMWVPAAQFDTQTMVAHVRAAGGVALDPSPLVRVIHGLDPSLLVDGRPMEDVTGAGTFTQRLIWMICGAAGIAAIVLAMVGIYGVMAYRVRLRTHELGVRIALGASPGLLMRQTVLDGVRMTAIGLGVGVAMAVIVAFAAGAGLAGVDPADPAAYLGAAGLVLLAAVVATVVPARHVAGVSPTVALRSE